MTTYYADFDLSTGDNDGTTQANAWQTLQDAIDGTNGTAPAAGDIVLCTGTDTISATVAIDQNSGDTTSGPIIFRGCNSSFANDGTRAVIDGNDIAGDLMYIDGVDHIHFENFNFKNTDRESGHDLITAHGYSPSYGIHFIGCIFEDAFTLVNTNNNGLSTSFFIYCWFKNAASVALDFYSNGNPAAILIGCIFSNISSVCIDCVNQRVIAIDCYFFDIDNSIFYYNSATGQRQLLIYNCTIDGDGGSTGVISAIDTVIHGSRITNNSIGINSFGNLTRLINSYMPGSGEDRANTTNTSGNVIETYIAGSNSNNLAGTDEDGGYADPTNGDFNLDPDKASQYNQAIDLEA